MSVMEHQAQTLRQYDQSCADEYEQIYLRDDTVRQAEQLELAAAVGRTCLNRQVLEIACGTGYWTQIADRVAQQVTAVDASEAVLDIAAAKQLERTTFVQGDAYRPALPAASATAGMALFWLSHVPRRQHSAFLNTFHQQLAPGATVLLADNQFVAGIGGQRSVPDAHGDTFKHRTLQDGPEYSILKNYFSAPELSDLLAPYAASLKISSGRCFWWAEYSLVSNERGQQP